MKRVTVSVVVVLLVTACGGGGGAAQSLRFAPSEGDSRSLRMTMDMAMDMNLDGEQAPDVEIPSFAVTMDVDVEDVDERIDIAFGYRDVEATGGDEEVRRQMQQLLAGLEGVEGTATMTSRGELLDASSSTPTGLDPMLASFVDQIEQQVGQLSVPFPEDPVRAGDSWTETTSFELSGITTTMDATYTLHEFNGADYVIEVDYVQATEPGPIQAPGGESLGEVIDGEGRGSGTFEGTLDFPMATQGTMSSSGTTRMRLQGGGQQQEMVQDIEMTMKLEPAN